MITVICDTRKELDTVERIIEGQYCFHPARSEECEKESSCRACMDKHVQFVYRKDVKLTKN